MVKSAAAERMGGRLLPNEVHETHASRAGTAACPAGKDTFPLGPQNVEKTPSQGSEPYSKLT